MNEDGGENMRGMKDAKTNSDLPFAVRDYDLISFSGPSSSTWKIISKK